MRGVIIGVYTGYTGGKKDFGFGFRRKLNNVSP